MNRTYELMLMVRPDMVDEEQQADFHARVFGDLGGRNRKEEIWATAIWPIPSASSTTASFCC